MKRIFLLSTLAIVISFVSCSKDGDGNENFTGVVTVTQKGTLKSLLQKYGLMDATQLTIAGTLGNADFETLIDLTFYNKLESLDLSDVNISILPTQALWGARLTSIILPENLEEIGLHALSETFWFEKTSQSLREMCRTLPFAGVTSYLGTTVADPIEEIKTCIRAADQVSEEDPEGAQLLGVHLEGPFINPVYKGMQKEECCLLPDVTVMEDLYNTFKNKKLCRHMTIAPERPGADAVLRFCQEHQIQTAVGHSAATFEEIKKMRAYGLGGFTHTFSGMKGFHHRELGTAGAALYFDDMICEFAKQTGMTVSHEAFELAYRIKPAKLLHMVIFECQL